MIIGKFAGNDKKLYKRLSDRYNQTTAAANESETLIEDADHVTTGNSNKGTTNSNSTGGVQSSPGHGSGKITLDASHKVLYYLVSCMNLAFPDFDFRFASS